MILHFFFLGMVLITASCAVLGNVQCKVKWASGSITTNKASGGDRIPAEPLKILEDDAIKVLYSIRQQLWKLSSGHRTGKEQFSFQLQRRAVVKNVQSTIQLYMNQELPHVQTQLEKAEEPEIKLLTFVGL